jgi:outer membrane protein assembly factor BamB
MALVGGALPQATGAARVTVSLDWPQFLHDPQHSSVSPATAFTPANAGSVSLVWRWRPPVISGQPTPKLDASPTVVAGRVYIGAQSGGFYALSESTGAVDWSRQLDTCPTRGITATAAVEPDPVTGVPTVYVSGARFLYALDAATGALVWKRRIGPVTANPRAYYNWSSPMVVAGRIYVGLASGCSGPLIRGGVVELSQHSGRVLHTWHSVPAGSIGGGVWSTVAASSSGSGLWVSTGSECNPARTTCPPGNQIGHSLSIVHLSSALKLLQAWQVPDAVGHDWDFGSSPTLFGGAGSVPAEMGACNKNGNYYAFARPLGSAPLWTDAIGEPGSGAGACIASSVWDGHTRQLFIAGTATTIGATSFAGSVREIDPATGAFIWQTGLPCSDMGTPSLDSAGVLAVATWSCTTPATPDVYLLDAATGAILTTLPTGSGLIFSQPVFAQGTLLVAKQTGGLYDFAPDGSPHKPTTVLATPAAAIRR